MTTPELSTSDLREILRFSESLARDAGKVILEGSKKIQTSSFEEKKNSVDLVTEYDVKVEELVKKEIAKHYPHFKL